MATSTTTSAATTYGDCVTSLRNSLSFLESSVSTLGTGVADFPRLIGVLKTVRHYELIPQPSLAAAEASLRDEIGPAIGVLLDRADAHIERVGRRIEALKARSDLQQGRMQHQDHHHHHAAKPSKKSKGKAPSMMMRANDGRKSLSGEAGAKLRAQALRQRREALKYSVERLELEVLQKERELRKRLENA
ncbi:DASH complex subunit spc19 [Diatrype stigma]|uniref:DASH complex subunit SPC19 n=1 Tax=Diatrype stigma TaxID=117547 RepID=A0AAN9UG72_9PEZI